jgi:hypothetical protein
MNTFSIISQYLLNNSKEIFIQKKDLTISNEEKHEFWKFIFSKELHITPDITSRVVNVLFYMYITKGGTYETKNKFTFLNESIENLFCNDAIRELFFYKFYRAQSIYHLLSRAAYRYKYRKYKVKVDRDIFLNQITETQRNTITILQNGYKYRFTLTDIINIINTCLGNTEFFFASPREIKNPYNNMPFSKAILYNIYFTIKASNFIMPQLFQAFFMENFNMAEYTLNNESIIRECSIKRHLETCSPQTLSSDIRGMLQNNFYGNKLKIDCEFPKDILVQIFKPYLHLYYLGNYAVDYAKRILKQDELDERIKAFFKYNRLFGRKNIEIKRDFLTKKRTLITCFNMKYLPFKKHDTDFYIDHLLDNKLDDEDESEDDEEEEGEIEDMVINNP